MNRHAIDALLRPPIELWSALIALLSAIIAAIAPWVLMLPPQLGAGFAMALLIFALIRARQAARALIYQRRLKYLSPYHIRRQHVPVSDHKLFLGRGFVWTQRHTQRLRDTLRPEVQHYVQPGRLYQWLRRKEMDWERSALLSGIAQWCRNGRFNPLKARPSLGGNSALHAVGLHEQDVWMNLAERVGHTLVLGTTRVMSTVKSNNRRHDESTHRIGIDIGRGCRAFRAVASE